MKIFVCIKQVSHIYVANAIDESTNQLRRDGVVQIVNPYDEVALEAALRIKDAAPRPVDVTAVSVGPKQAESALRWCLAMGADRAVHVIDEDQSNRDPWHSAGMLAEVIRGRISDQAAASYLILCGRMAVDTGMGQGGTFLAELLGLPVVTAIASLELDSACRTARLQRLLDRGSRQRLTCSVPAVFTVDRHLNRPRYPTLPGRFRARQAPLEVIAPRGLREAQAPSGIELLGIAAPRLRPKKILSPDSNLSAGNRMQFVMGGGKAQKAGGSIGGDPNAMANGIFNFLKEKCFL